MTYAEKLLDPRWQKKRLEILERDNWMCQLCLDKDTTLHIHHEKYAGNPWETDDGDLITYCKHCHEIIEYNKRSEDIIPVRVYKVELESGIIQLHLIYKEANGPVKWLDIYQYNKNARLIYLCSISDENLYWIKKTIFHKSEAPS